MIKKINHDCCLLSIGIILISFVCFPNAAYSQDPNGFFEWGIGTSKLTFYPGEPVLLTINITNNSTQEEDIDFGWDGLEAFSMEIFDSNNTILCKDNKIKAKGGLSRVGRCRVTTGKNSSKKIILNRWCSSLLPPGLYHLKCNVDYRLFSEDQKQPNTRVFKAGPVHKTQLELDIRIVEMDKPEFKKIIENMGSVACQTEPDTQNKREWLDKRDLAREMLAFTESEMAVPYQLRILRVEQYTRLKQDIINSLVISGTPEAANGLMQIIEDPNVFKEDIKNDSISAVYRLRDTGKPDIINATEGFAAKYKRPVLSEPVD